MDRILDVSFFTELVMQVSKETVTPKKAMEWLKRNVHNRPLSSAHVNRMAGAMKAGAWKFNGETIKFNGNGDLIDGQHRLNACVQSGTAFDAYVVKGLPHEAFDTIDQGKLRTAADVLARRGEKHYSLLAAAARIVHSMMVNGSVDNGGGVRVDELSACIEANPGLRDCCEFASQNRTRLVPKSLVGGLLYLFRQKDEATANAFWTQVLSGEGLTAGMPAYRLRERFIVNSTSAAKLRPRELAAITIKAWNFARAKKSVKALAWFDREEFPAIQ